MAPLLSGFVLPGLKLAVLTEADLTGRRRAHRAPRPRSRDSGRFFEDLKPGDYIVHYHHGVGRYGGMVQRAIGGVERDYLLLEYKGGDKLYVPSDQIDAVRHYVGGEAPALHRLGGSDFARAKGRVRQEVRRIAQELVVLYQKRLSTPGHAFSPDTPWQQELEDVVPVRRDARPAEGHRRRQGSTWRPSARWTAWSAATSASARPRWPSGPRSRPCRTASRWPSWCPPRCWPSSTTPPSRDRFAGYPVRVEVLSRFLTPGQAKAVVDGLAAGEVDCVIGTHRLLSGDIHFKDLGLLVVDEEQRFGVSHKEAMKQLSADVDVLTLTATPIPRTLEMSLTGIRDLTLLNTPPADRQPILTYVGEYDERAVAEAIRRELLREGQVFFVHNRVQDIEMVAGRPARPRARGADRHRPRPDGRGHPRAGGASTSGRASTTSCSAPPSSRAASTCRR